MVSDNASSLNIKQLVLTFFNIPRLYQIIYGHKLLTIFQSAVLNTDEPIKAVLIQKTTNKLICNQISTVFRKARKLIISNNSIQLKVSINQAHQRTVNFFVEKFHKCYASKSKVHVKLVKITTKNNKLKEKHI